MFLMGIMDKLKMCDYWTTDPHMSTPIFSGIMSRKRFQAILKFLHFIDNANQTETGYINFGRYYGRGGGRGGYFVNIYH